LPLPMPLLPLLSLLLPLCPFPCALVRPSPCLPLPLLSLSTKTAAAVDHQLCGSGDGGYRQLQYQLLPMEAAVKPLMLMTGWWRRHQLLLDS
jgi:hypothetical protein